MKGTKILQKLFYCFMISVLLATAVMAETVECEDYNSITPGDPNTRLWPEDKSNASGGKALHMGPDWSPDTTWGIGDEAVYTINLQAYDKASIRIKYADDVAGNVVKVYLDNVEKGQFVTFYTGGWNDFEWTDPIFLGNIDANSHTIKLEMVTGGSYGVLLDVFEVRNAVDDITAFMKSSINSSTGLVESREGDNDNFTTIYKNALAAMVFIHEGDVNSAKGIFDFFKSVYDADPNNFSGFIKDWNAGTGQPAGTNHWVGDNAFLLLALNYYDKTNGSLGIYADMSDALIEWLIEEGNDCGSLIAEGAANCYAALALLEGYHDVDTALIQFKTRFYNDVSYSTVLDHTARAALTFGNIDGFDYLSNFERTETWDLDDVTEVSAYSGFNGENFINLEISAQLLNAWNAWSSDLLIDLSDTEGEIEKLWLNGSSDSNSCGLPYFVTDGHGFDDAYSLPIIDSTAFMCYYYWNFNPYAPGEKCVPALGFDYCECEDYNSATFGGIGDDGVHPDSQSHASGCSGLHIGPGWSNDPNYSSWGIGDNAVYVVNLQAYDNASIRVRYSDDVAGNVIKVYLDNAEKGQFTTIDTGTWNDFAWTDPILIGTVTAGQHTIKLEMTAGGGVGVMLDVLKIEPLDTVHFSVPYSQRSQANYSGAACLKMALDYEGTNSYTQSGLHTYGVSQNHADNSAISYIDPQGMYKTMNNKELHASYNYSYFGRATINEAYHDICHWIGYEVAVPSPHPENMPAMIPVGGNYENWVIVNGYSANDDPWTASIYTIYGFWITDPAVSGIGQNVYKTAAELANDFVSMDTSDIWDGKYVTICEPPEYSAKVTIAEPIKFKDKLLSKKDVVDAAIKGLEDNVLGSDNKLKRAYIKSCPAEPILVQSRDGNYFIVPFVKNRGCSVAVIVDAQNGAFKQASYSSSPDVKYLKRLKKSVLKLKGKGKMRRRIRNAFLPVELTKN